MELLETQRLCPNPENNPRCLGLLTYSNKWNCITAADKGSPCSSCGWIQRHKTHKKHNLEKLLDGSLESCYWVGFLLADGWLSDNGELSLELSNKDSTHLDTFSKFIDFKGKKQTRTYQSKATGTTLKSVKVAIRDKFLVDKLRKKFDIKTAKSYNPPSLENFKSFSEKQVRAILIGYIDGDGSMSAKKQNTKHINLKVACHISWEGVLKHFMKYLGSSTRFNVCSHGLATINNGRYGELVELKQFAVDNSLPIMQRKWKNINL